MLGSVNCVCLCSITVTGAKSLATGLAKNKTMKSLDILLNDLMMDGTIAILAAAEANGTCQQVNIDKYKNDDKVREMMTILEERKRQEVGGS